MKTPEEIKKGLEYCGHAISCYDCLYFDGDDCNDALLDDALALIQRLEAERDALLAALKKCDLDCTYCKHNTDNDGRCTDGNVDCENCQSPCPCRSCVDMGKWEWCKPKEAE